MSKAVSRHLLDDQKIIGGPLRFESRAASSPSRESATDAAIKVVKQTLGQDLLSDHRPRRMGVGFLYEADLILATDRAVLGAIDAVFDKYPGSESDKKQVEAEIWRKSFLLSEFFGSTGDIPDPWPDRNDAESLARYEACIARLRDLIEPNVDKLTEFRSKAAPIAFGTSRLSI
jgi:protein-tyrosine-phosphatase